MQNPIASAWLRRRAFWLPHLLIIAVTAVYVLRYYYVFPILDYLEAVRLFERMHEGRLHWYEAHFLYGGHWYLLSTNWEIFLAQFTHWNLFYEALSTLGFLILTWVLWLRCALRGTQREQNRPAALALVAGTFMIFSLDQATNLLWTHQMSHFIHNAGVMLAVAAATAPRLRWGNFLLVLAGAAIAIYSFSAGFALLPVILILLLIHPDVERVTRLLFIALWLVFSAACIVNFHERYSFYLLDDYKTGMHFELSLSFFRDFVFFLSGFLGASITRTATILIPVVALAGIIATAGLTLKFLKQKRRESGWMAGAALALFALGAGAITFIGRHQFGYEQGLNPRYFNLSNLFWLGLLILFLQAEMPDAATSPWRKRLLALAVCLLIALKLVNAVHYGKKQIRVSQEYNAVARLIARQGTAASDETLRKVFWDPRRARHYVAAMQALELNIFAGSKSGGGEPPPNPQP